MSLEAKIPDTDDDPIIAPCRGGCGVEIPTSYAIKAYGDDGSVEILMAVDQCADCEAELERRVAEHRVDAARRRAKYEKNLADLINSIPKPKHEQAELDMGLD